MVLDRLQVTAVPMTIDLQSQLNGLMLVERLNSHRTSETFQAIVMLKVQMSDENVIAFLGVEEKDAIRCAKEVINEESANGSRSW